MILVIDVGTSSLRAALMDGQGKIRHMEQREYPLLMLPHDGVEMDLAVLDRALDDALEAVGQWLRTTQAQVQAVSVTAQRSSVIPVDREGRALANALMWQDRRAAPVCDALRDKEFDLFRRCGLRLSPVFSAPKMCYLQDTSPQIYEQAYKLVGFQEYVLHHLCGAWATTRRPNPSAAAAPSAGISWGKRRSEWKFWRCAKTWPPACGKKACAAGGCS